MKNVARCGAVSCIEGLNLKTPFGARATGVITVVLSVV